MRRHLILSLLVGLLGAVIVEGKRAAPPPLSMQVAVADAIVLGKAISFGPKLVAPETGKADAEGMQIAEVEVTENLLGSGLKKIRVGFYPVVGGRSGRVPTMTPELGQEAFWILTAHPSKKDTFLMRNYFDMVQKKDNPDFTRQVDEIRRCVKLLKNPMLVLKGKDRDNRYLVMAMLVTRYRTVRTGMEKQASIPVEESKLLLETLADADWTGNTAGQSGYVAPLGLFHRLGITDKDGWNPPKEFAQFSDHAKKWLRDNAGTYQIKRFAPEPSVEPEP